MTLDMLFFMHAVSRCCLHADILWQIMVQFTLKSNYSLYASISIEKHMCSLPILVQTPFLIEGLSFNFRTDALKIGTLKGTDEFGNRYYENKQYFIGNVFHYITVQITFEQMLLKYMPLKAYTSKDMHCASCICCLNAQVLPFKTQGQVCKYFVLIFFTLTKCIHFINGLRNILY